MGKQKFYWKKAPRGNTKFFIEFLHQLRQNHKGKKLVFIVDNVSFHRSKKMFKWLNKYNEILLVNLPTYSPEYNPVEQVWKWLKPLVYGARTLDNGLEEILKKIRMICWHWREGRLIKPLKVGNGIWNVLL